MPWLKSNDIDYQHTGKFYKALGGPYTGKIGEAVHSLSWGGTILEFPDGIKITFSNGDIQPIESITPARKVQRIKPRPDCPSCFGEGTVYDTVDYGSTTAQLPSNCACVEEQADEDTDEIEIDLSDWLPSPDTDF